VYSNDAYSNVPGSTTEEQQQHQRSRALTAWDAPALSAGKGGRGGGARGGEKGNKVIKRDGRKQSVYNGFEEDGMDETPV
jgi:hypothetical protein